MSHFYRGEPNVVTASVTPYVLVHQFSEICAVLVGFRMTGSAVEEVLHNKEAA
jgi:hypothetical protein